jgi:hypothetical protein
MCSGQGLMRRVRWTFELDLIALRIVEIDRRSVSFRSVALDGFADRYAERRQPGDDGVTVERRHAKAEMVHVGSILGALARNQIQHRRPRAHLYEMDPVQPALDVEAQNLFVELNHRCEVTDPEHDMVDSFDMESHGD